MAFSAKVLVCIPEEMVRRLKDAGNSGESGQQSIREILEEFVKNELCWYDDSGDVDGYYPKEPDTLDEYCFGFENPEAISNYASEMEGSARNLAESLILANKEVREVSGDNVRKIVRNIALDSTDTYRMLCAFEILDNVPNSECTDLFLTDGIWRVFPKGDELRRVHEAPECYAVISVLFA